MPDVLMYVRWQILRITVMLICVHRCRVYITYTKLYGTRMFQCFNLCEFVTLGHFAYNVDGEKVGSVLG